MNREEHEQELAASHARSEAEDRHEKRMQERKAQEKKDIDHEDIR